jgi:hypothetical protein
VLVPVDDVALDAGGELGKVGAETPDADPVVLGADLGVRSTFVSTMLYWMWEAARAHEGIRSGHELLHVLVLRTMVVVNF